MSSAAEKSQGSIGNPDGVRVSTALRVLYEAARDHIRLRKISPDHSNVSEDELSPVDYGRGEYAKLTRNMIEIGSLEIESEPHEIGALNLAKRTLMNLAYDEPSGKRFIDEVSRFRKIEEEINTENPQIDWAKHFWDKAMVENDNPAGHLAESIISAIRDLRFSDALCKLLPLTDYLVKEEENGNHVLGTRSEG